jgi:hypothetical protein
MTRCFFFLVLLFALAPAHAAPGAHGPNGEHLDAPGAPTHTVSATPRLETVSETFELVARLEPSELSILLDRFETNEPVLGGKIEVESNGVKAVGHFRADHADYAVTDERLLKALAQPGQHPLVFTVFAGNDSDLLEGALAVSSTHGAHGHNHRHFHVGKWTAAGVVLLAVAGAAWAWRRRWVRGLIERGA